MVVTTTQHAESKPAHKTRRSMKKKVERMAVDDAEMDQDHPQLGSSSVPDEELMIDTDAAIISPPTAAPAFPALPASAVQGTLKSETRRIPIPPHRMTPLKKDWINIFGPLTEMLGLQVRMNVQ